LMSADLFGATVYHAHGIEADWRQRDRPIHRRQDQLWRGASKRPPSVGDERRREDIGRRGFPEWSTLAGTAVETDPKEKDHPMKYTFKATRVKMA
jgi:hypothetical protein